MTIAKNSYRVSRLDGDFLRGTVDDEDESALSQSSGDGVLDNEESDVDSGMSSDEFDVSELGQPGTELCQVGNQQFSFPLELYDIPNLALILSPETWNVCLTEEERFALSGYLPDLDQEEFAVTLKELFSGSNFHFGCPLSDFFNQLKGGLCDPLVVLERRGLNIFQRRQHYHQLCEYQNSMVGSLVKIRDAWQNCNEYGIEERLSLLNNLRSQRNLGHGRNGDLGSESDSRCCDSDEAHLNRSLGEGRGSPHSSKIASFNALSRTANKEMVQFVKDKAKGLLKVSASKVFAKKESLRGSGFDLSKVTGGTKDNCLADPQYGSDCNEARHTTVGKYAALKSKRQDSVKRSAQSVFGEEDPDEYVSTSSYLNRRKNSNLAFVVAPYDSYDFNALNRMKKLKQGEDCKYPSKKLHRRSSVIFSDANQPYIQDPTRGIAHMSDANKFNNSKQCYPSGWKHHLPESNLSRRHPEVHGKSSCLDHPGVFGDSRKHKVKEEDDFRTTKTYIDFDSKVSSCKAPSAERSCSSFHSRSRNKTLQEKPRRSTHHRRAGMEYSRNSPVYPQSEETQSDSSGQVEEGRHMTPYAKRSVLSSAAMDVRSTEPEHDYKFSSKQVRFTKKGSHAPDGGGICDQTLELELNTLKVKKKGKANNSNCLNDDKSLRKRHMTHFSEKLHPTSYGSRAAKINPKGTTDLHYSLEQASDMSNHVRGIFDKAEESLNLDARLTVTERQTNKSRSRSQISAGYSVENDHLERSSVPILDCKSMLKKKKYKGGVEGLDQLDEPIQYYSSSKKQIEDSSARKKKRKRKTDLVVANLSVVIPEPVIMDKGVSEIEMNKDTHKKLFTLITPTIHTGFSFSVIHLLSAVRKALITQVEDAEDIDNHLGKDDPSKMFLDNANGMFMSQSLDHLDGSILQDGGLLSNLPALSVKEIVHRVRSNPGDPCILETAEPLQDLVRGVLKIFSSKTAPLGAKGWKALVLYKKAIKSWSWVGPVSSSSSDNDNTEEETSAEAWSIPHKMLVKLVDAFANWLKNGQETLQQIGTLPAPPAVLPVMDYKDRFRDLRAQKSLNTISPSSEELKAYFHREELLRYSIPDRAFQYTAVDGRKTIVAPLKRGGGKPTSKARDHYMLKTDRPPHVTVLCLVRDAASRLPGSIGTRADVCTLIRDSQYIVEDVTDSQVNQVVSGALDRLHYERDPCVQFDGERKLWVYLHHDREEEDFEDDGTSSTKKWKRQKKDATDPPEVEATNESNCFAMEEPTAGGSSACDLNPDLDVFSSEANVAEKGELVYNDLRPNRENVQSFIKPSLCERDQSNPIHWGELGGNPLQETKMLCQENFTNQDFDDESFSRERSVGLLSASLY